MEQLIREAEQSLKDIFLKLDEIELRHMGRVLDLFKKNQVSVRNFNPSTGYGYGDVSRDELEKIYAELFNKDEAIVRPQLTSGTHTLSLCFFGILLPKDELLYVTGEPYDTMQSVIGNEGEKAGTLKELGISFRSIDGIRGNGLDEKIILSGLKQNTKLVVFQRSRGYASRKSLAPSEINRLSRLIHEIRPDIYTMVDNCYGEFCCLDENMDSLDIIAGSLIKNIGGGLAPTGGYIAGSKRAIERIETRLTAPGIGRETGSYEGSYRPFYQGLFMAPHTVNQALKTVCLASYCLEKMGFKCIPGAFDERNDITQAVELKSAERLIEFCKQIQFSSPVDSFAEPEPWPMPGYQDEVIMAAGTFVSGASIELSCDGPLREPFTAYLQGGLCYSHGRIAIKNALEALNKIK